jgi:CHAD domain-containing protein
MAKRESSNPPTCSPPSVSEAARSQVRRRLRKAAKALRQIKRGRTSADAVHDLRVWSRRATTALDFFAAVLPCKKARRMERALRKLRGAAGDVRDCDVLLAAFEQRETNAAVVEIARQTRRMRRRAVKPLARRAKKWTKRHKLKRRGKRVIDGIRWRRRSGKQNEPAFAIWGREQLQPLLREFADAARGDLSNDDALHACRIAAKRLRYAAELVGSACPEITMGAPYEQLMQLQDRLGRVRDHRANADQLRRQADKAKRDHRPLFDKAAAREGQLLEREKRQFLRWWTRARQRTLLGGWSRLIANGKGKNQPPSGQRRSSQPK